VNHDQSLHARAFFNSLLGTPIDADDRFLELIERWVKGEVEMSEVAGLWRNLPSGFKSAALCNSALLVTA
jgi:hypothetical protein